MLKKKLTLKFEMNNYISNITIICTLLIAMCSCGNYEHKFSKVEWNIQNDMGEFSNRQKLLPILLKQYTFKGMKYSNLVIILGELELIANDNNGFLICENIITNYGINIDPIYTENLIFELNKDSIVVKYYLKKENHNL